MWNLTRELIQREHNFGGSFDYRRCSLHFDVNLMNITHRLDLSLDCPKKVSFCLSGNLLCALYRYGFDRESQAPELNYSIFWNWKHGVSKLHVLHNEHGVNDIKFLRKTVDEEAAEIVTISNRSGCLERAVHSEDDRTFITHWLPKQKQHIVMCPLNFDEIISACEDGKIFIINFKTNAEHTKPSTIVQNSAGDSLGIQAFAHHPFKPEICVACSDSCLRIYEKQNMEKPSKKFCLRTGNEFSKIVKCSYSWDGCEILSTFDDNETYLLSNNGNKSVPLKVAKSENYKDLQFFGMCSKYLVGIQGMCNLWFLEKSTGLTVKKLTLNEQIEILSLEIHPNLPVLAALTAEHGIFICAPEGKPLQPFQNFDEKCLLNDTGFDVS